MQYSTSIIYGHFVDDYEARLELGQGGSADLTLSFRSPAAYRAARDRLPAADREGEMVTAVLGETDDARRTLRYKILLDRGLLSDPHSELYLYTGERFRRVLAAPAE